MAKTITVRLDDETYDLIRNAAKGEMRSISNFIEYATLAYLTEESFVSDEEMEQLLSDEKLLATLKGAGSDVAEKRYHIVE